MIRFEKLIKDIYLLRTPFSSIWSGVFLVNGEEPVLIDAGAGTETVDQVIVPALEAIDVAPTSIKWIINTHAHADHANGNPRLLQVTGAKLAAFETCAYKLRDPLTYSIKTRTRYPEYSPKPPTYIQPVEADLILREGDTLAKRLKLFSTPGHDTECISILDKDTNSVFAGDSLQFDGTLDGNERELAFYKDLPAYRKSICKIRALKADNLFTSHEYIPMGPLFFGRDAVEKCLNYNADQVSIYTARIQSLLKKGIVDTDQLAREMVWLSGGMEGEYLFPNMYTVDEHIKEIRRLQGE